MSEPVTTTSLRTLFKFPFQGSDWRNRFIIGALVTFGGFFIPIVPLIFLLGYILRVTRQAIKGEDPAQPAWEDWGKLGVDGLRLLLINLVYLLPGTLVLVGGWVLYMGGALAWSLVSTTEEPTGVVLALVSLYLASMGILLFSTVIGTLLLALGSIPLPVATAHFAAKDRVAAAFRVREWWPILRSNKLGYFIAWVFVAGLWAISYCALVLVYYSVVLCCLVPVLVAPVGYYLLLISAALFGQTYRQSVALLPARPGAPATAGRS